MRDCSQCMHGGKPSMGKVRCFLTHDEVEIDFTEDGVPIGFTYAEKCDYFKPREVSE